MRRTFSAAIFLLCSVVFVNGQRGSGNDPCMKVSAGASATVYEDKECRERQEFENRINALRNNGKQTYVRDRYKKDRIFIDVIRPLYRDLTDKEKPLLAPDQDLSEKYADFLNDKKTGLVKLMTDRGCDGGTETVAAVPQCEKFQMPGAGSSYSFRANRYSMKRLADVTFIDGNFDTAGLVKHGILVNIGDVELDKVNLKTKELETIVTFQPIKDYNQAEAFSGILTKGVKAGDLVFANSLKVEENKTYGLRSIAYRTPIYRQIQDTVYDEFDFDERDDVIIIFRVVRYNPGESVTILWKELERDDAPKMHLPKEALK